jgi:Mitochondrial ribosomal protein subunit L20
VKRHYKQREVRILTRKEVAELKRLRKRNPKHWTYAQLATYFSCGIWQIEKVLAGRSMRASENEARRVAKRRDAAEQEPRRPPPIRDTRDLTARLLGDPLPGQSALDRKREAECSTRNPLRPIGFLPELHS